MSVLTTSARDQPEVTVVLSRLSVRRRVVETAAASTAAGAFACSAGQHEAVIRGRAALHEHVRLQSFFEGLILRHLSGRYALSSSNHKYGLRVSISPMLYMRGVPRTYALLAAFSDSQRGGGIRYPPPLGVAETQQARLRWMRLFSIKKNESLKQG